jgi:hypothetical protein
MLPLVNKYIKLHYKHNPSIIKNVKVTPSIITHISNILIKATMPSVGKCQKCQADLTEMCPHQWWFPEEIP